MRQFFAHASALASYLRQLIGALGPLWDIRKYLPELHYMRGPGPKWHEKHSSLPSSSAYGRRSPRKRFRFCREGNRVPTFPDHALDLR